MTKRQFNFENGVDKRLKLDDVNDLWGDDDFDSEAIEDCFERASQSCTANANITFLPSYNSFKQGASTNAQIITSTQAGTSFIQINNKTDLEAKIKNLEQTCREKDGEITILRANLKNLHESTVADKEKKQNEFKQKLSAAIRENQTAKSELEFKNLEVANLKRRISELAKIVQSENSTQKTKTEVVNAPVCSSHLEIKAPEFYPLKRFQFHKIFPLEQQKIIAGSTTVYSDLVYLTNLSLHEVNSIEAKQVLESLQKFLKTLLDDLDDYLTQLESRLQVQEIQHSDSLYLQGNIQSNPDKQIGVNCGKIMGFLAGFLPFHASLFNDFDNILLDIMTKIGKTRQSLNCREFILNLVRVLTRIFSLNREISDLNAIVEITRQLFLSRPDSNAVVCSTFFLKTATRNRDFVEKLCNKDNSVKNNTSRHKGVIYFSKNSCVFQIFAVLLENARDLDLSRNVLSIIYNIFKSDAAWLYVYENKHCDCLSKLYKIGIETVYNSLEKCKACKYFLKCCIKIMSLLLSNSEYLIQKYVSEFAQFKEIVNSLNEICGGSRAKLDVDVLNEEIPDIPKSVFINIDF